MWQTLTVWQIFFATFRQLYFLRKAPYLRNCARQSTNCTQFESYCIIFGFNCCAGIFKNMYIGARLTIMTSLWIGKHISIWSSSFGVFIAKTSLLLCISKTRWCGRFKTSLFWLEMHFITCYILNIVTHTHPCRQLSCWYILFGSRLLFAVCRFRLFEFVTERQLFHVWCRFEIWRRIRVLRSGIVIMRSLVMRLIGLNLHEDCDEMPL